MLYGRVDQRDLYEKIDPKLTEALALLAAYEPSEFAPGRKDIHGNQMFLLQAAYETKTREASIMEAHKAYIDVMYMLEGTETIYVKPTDQMETITAPYNPETDLMFGKIDDNASTIVLCPGDFVALYPQDGHAPGCAFEEVGLVRKLIVKVALG